MVLRTNTHASLIGELAIQCAPMNPHVASNNRTARHPQRAVRRCAATNECYGVIVTIKRYWPKVFRLK